MKALRLPKSNKGAAIGAVLVAGGLALLQALVAYALTGQPFPVTRDEWIRFVVVILGGLFLSPQTPRYSLTEQRTGRRTFNPPPTGTDAPVVTEAKGRAMERESLQREARDT